MMNRPPILYTNVCMPDSKRMLNPIIKNPVSVIVFCLVSIIYPASGYPDSNRGQSHLQCDALPLSYIPKYSFGPIISSIHGPSDLIRPRLFPQQRTKPLDFPVLGRDAPEPTSTMNPEHQVPDGPFFWGVSVGSVTSGIGFEPTRLLLNRSYLLSKQAL